MQERAQGASDSPSMDDPESDDEWNATLAKKERKKAKTLHGETDPALDHDVDEGSSQRGAGSSTAQGESALEKLLNMGFQQVDADQALQLSGGAIDEAIGLLVSWTTSHGSLEIN